MIWQYREQTAFYFLMVSVYNTVFFFLWCYHFSFLFLIEKKMRFSVYFLYFYFHFDSTLTCIYSKWWRETAIARACVWGCWSTRGWSLSDSLRIPGRPAISALSWITEQSSSDTRQQAATQASRDQLILEFTVSCHDVTITWQLQIIWPAMQTR